MFNFSVYKRSKHFFLELFRFETKVTITRFVCAFIIKYNSNYIRFRFIVVQFCLSREKEEEKKTEVFCFIKCSF